MFCPFFEQDHLLNVIILEVYVKRSPKCACISKQIDVAQNLFDDYFFYLRLSEDLSTGKILGEKKCGGRGLISEKVKTLYAEYNKRAEGATSCYSGTGDFL